MFIIYILICYIWFFVQAEDGIRDLVRSRGLGDVYKRQIEMYRNNNSSKLTKLELIRFDMPNRIASGTFEAILIKQSNKDTLRITEGRFDVRF